MDTVIKCLLHTLYHELILLQQIVVSFVFRKTMDFMANISYAGWEIFQT